MTPAQAAVLGETIRFGAGLVMVVSAWVMLGQPRPLLRCLAVTQAGLLTWGALSQLPHIFWVVLGLVSAPLAATPHPHVGLARFREAP